MSAVVTVLVGLVAAIRNVGLAVTPANVDAVIKRQSTLADRQAGFAPTTADPIKNLHPLSQIG